MQKKEAKAKAVMELPKAIAYLDDLVTSLKAGRLTLTSDGDEVSITPGDSIKVEVKAAQKSEKEAFSIELSWRKTEECTAEASFKIGSEVPTSDEEPSSADEPS